MYGPSLMKGLCYKVFLEKCKRLTKMANHGKLKRNYERPYNHCLNMEDDNVSTENKSTGNEERLTSADR